MPVLPVLSTTVQLMTPPPAPTAIPPPSFPRTAHHWINAPVTELMLSALVPRSVLSVAVQSITAEPSSTINPVPPFVAAVQRVTTDPNPPKKPVVPLPLLVH